MKVGFLGNYTIDFIAKEYKKNTKDDVYVSDYCQYHQQLAFADSQLYAFEPDFVVLILDGNEINDLDSYEMFLKDIEALIDRFILNSDAGYLIISNIYIKQGVNSCWDYNKEDNLKKKQANFNLALNSLSVKHNRVFILDQLSLVERHGAINIYDDALWVFGKNRFNKKGLSLISGEIENLMGSILNRSKKCLVLDLDNTLWGGVLGEDGLGGIKLGAEGVGRVYSDFQKEILSIKKKGVLLAICSKNNISDVEEFFAEHENKILNLKDFVTHRINWELKSDNVKSIAKELNISEDSIVFIDDNPVERELVAASTECVVPEFPQSIELLLDFICDVDKQYFSKQNITSEDQYKTKQYFENARRSNARDKYESYADFVSSLGMVLSIGVDREKDLSRVAQLTQKTNQFNFTSIRYSEEEIKRYMVSENSMVYSGSVKDKYGDYGVVLVMIVTDNDAYYQIDTFLMSCRVIGKMVEDVFLNSITSRLREGVELRARYVPSKKNIVIKNKLDDLNFDIQCVDETGVKEYKNICPVLSSEKIGIEVVYEG